MFSERVEQVRCSMKSLTLFICRMKKLYNETENQREFWNKVDY